MRQIQMEASRHGYRLFRNNVGTGLVVRGKSASHREAIIKACQETADRMGGSAARINFGLGEDSADLIGWTPVKIREQDVGRVIAVFTGPEIKFGRGKQTEGQFAWMNTVKTAGGIALVLRSVDDVAKIAPQFDFMLYNTNTRG